MEKSCSPYDCCLLYVHFLKLSCLAILLRLYCLKSNLFKFKRIKWIVTLYCDKTNYVHTCFVEMVYFGKYFLYVFNPNMFIPKVVLYARKRFLFSYGILLPSVKFTCGRVIHQKLASVASGHKLLFTDAVYYYRKRIVSSKNYIRFVLIDFYLQCRYKFWNITG